MKKEKKTNGEQQVDAARVTVIKGLPHLESETLQKFKKLKMELDRAGGIKLDPGAIPKTQEEKESRLVFFVEYIAKRKVEQEAGAIFARMDKVGNLKSKFLLKRVKEMEREMVEEPKGSAAIEIYNRKIDGLEIYYSDWFKSKDFGGTVRGFYYFLKEELLESLNQGKEPLYKKLAIDQAEPQKLLSQKQNQTSNTTLKLIDVFESVANYNHIMRMFAEWGYIDSENNWICKLNGKRALLAGILKYLCTKGYYKDSFSKITHQQIKDIIINTFPNITNFGLSTVNHAPVDTYSVPFKLIKHASQIIV